ncbi:MAG: glycosyltransferase [Gammaproteobacteria bacterium]|nr:glycosyltransferase [Gammaproteobacteria bacterium]
MGRDKKLIVITAINFADGGPLSILKDCLRYVAENLSERFEIVALVHNKELFNIPNVHFKEFPYAKRSWLIRLYYEWFYFNKLSARLKPFLWLSLHDITPRVNAERSAVYCHNPSPFYDISFKEVWLDPVFLLFNKLYSFLYRINIHNNDWVIVQQEWLRQEFKARYSPKEIIVAHPELIWDEQSGSDRGNGRAKKTFLFPTYPRVFKNIDLIGEAACLLEDAGYKNYEIKITIDGSENRYAKDIVHRFSANSSIKFIGIQSREQVFKLYEEADCLIFPSKLETWGMPISEYKLLGKPVLVADLPYAHETVGQYDKVMFFPPTDASQLANYMMRLIDGKLQFDSHDAIVPPQPFAHNWKSLFEILLQK